MQDYTAATERQGLRFQSSERCQNHLRRKTPRQQSRAGDRGNASSSPLTASSAASMWKTAQESRDHNWDFNPAENRIRSESCRELLSNVAVPGGTCAMGLEEVRTAKPRGVSVPAPPGSGESSAFQEAFPWAPGSSAWNWEGPGEDHDSHQRTQKEAYKSLNKSPNLTTTESDMEEDAEFYSVMKFAPF